MEQDDYILEDFLEHYGVLGMKWGIRKDGPPGVSRKINRDASKDAREFARAKQFYGEGAGTRRKLIKAKVEQKSKNSASYKSAFDHHLSRQDMSKHSDKAVSERKRTDRIEKTKQRAGYIARRLTGEWGTQAAFTAAAVAGVAYLNSPQGRSKMSTTMNRATNIVNDRRNSATTDFLTDYLNRNS